jgi:hypothetical protein
MQTIIEALLFEIRESIPSSSHFIVTTLNESDCTIQLGRSPEALVAITLQDAVRPSFAATYPALSVDRDGHETITEQTSEGILCQGVSWIVRKVFRFGFVPPEGYRRSARNSGIPQRL